jgi:hypothetical protein
MITRCTARLDPNDVSIFGMLMSGTSIADTASVLSTDAQQIEDRLRGMLSDVLADSPRSQSAPS